MPVKFEDYYKVLGVARDAAADEIKRAYRKLAQKLHPDRNKAADAAEKFGKVSEAYEVLKDPDKRSKYDQFGQNYKAGQDFRPPPGHEGFGGGARHSGGGFEFEGGDFSDFFQQMFGGRGPGSPPGSGPGSGNPFGGGRPAPPREQEAEITVSLHEAYHGSTRQLTLSGGNPGGGEKKLDIKIPPRLKPGSRIRLKGENLLLKINVAPDPRFKIEGVNLTTDLKITPALAALGGKADVETLDGTVTMTIPPGIAAAGRLRLAGKGLGGKPGLKDDGGKASGGKAAGGGDLLIRVLITVPKSLTDDQRELYERLRDLETDFT